MTTPTDLMRDQLVAALFPHLAPLGVSQATIYAAVDAALATTNFTLLLDAVVSADGNLTAFVGAIPEGEEPPEGADLSAYDLALERLRNGNKIYEDLLEP